MRKLTVTILVDDEHALDTEKNIREFLGDAPVPLAVTVSNRTHTIKAIPARRVDIP